MYYAPKKIAYCRQSKASIICTIVSKQQSISFTNSQVASSTWKRHFTALTQLESEDKRELEKWSAVRGEVMHDLVIQSYEE